MKVYLYIISALCLLLITGCEHPYTPKPASYPRVSFPAKAYKTFDTACPFTFRYPVYGVVQHDNVAGADPCWYNIELKQFNATLHLSYKPVTSFANFSEMANDARTFAYKHTVKAEDIVDSPFHMPNHVNGIFYNIEGNTASALQFFATDSTKHYLRVALYFNSRPNKDSIAPILGFLKTDVDTLIHSLRWK